MSDSSYAGGSGRKGTPKLVLRSEDKQECSECGNQVRHYADGSVQAHRVIDPDKPSFWSWCSNRQWL